jgi:stearoyl-CoA desaturase (Delta-9 desaturase)
MVIPIFFLAHWYGSLLAQTIFLHRYAAHRMYSLNKFWERIFFLTTYLFQGSSFLNPRAYAILHRLHHAHSDTPEDPHSPVIHPNVMTMMLHTKNKYLDILDNKMQVTKEHLSNIPRWHWLEGFAEKPWSRLGWAAAYITFYVFFAESWYWYLLLPIHFLMGPIHGAIVNWAGHKIGYRNFDSKDNSRNTLAFDFVTLGELFQNNHHKFPGRSNFAKRWWEIDPGYWIMRGMHAVGIIKMKKLPRPRRAMHQAKEKAQHLRSLKASVVASVTLPPVQAKEPV